MPIPCFDNTCTVELDVSGTGALIAYAHICDVDSIPIVGGTHIQHQGTNTVAAYDSDNAGILQDDTLLVTNPFDCTAVWVIYDMSFKIHGERRNDSGDVSEVFYCTNTANIGVAGGGVSNLKGIFSNRFDIAGEWISGFADYQFTNDMSVRFQLPAGATTTVTGGIDIIQHRHFDLTGGATAGRSGTQGITILPGTATFLPIRA